MSGKKTDKGDEDLGGVVRAATARILQDPEASSAKIVAWAYSCTPSGAEEDRRLFELLRMKLDIMHQMLGVEPPPPEQPAAPTPTKASKKPPREDDPF